MIMSNQRGKVLIGSIPCPVTTVSESILEEKEK